MDTTALRAPGLNKLLFFVLLLLSCKQADTNLTQRLNVANSRIQVISGITYADGAPANGMLYELFPNSTDTACISHYKNGRQDGVYKTFYPQGRRKELRYFRKGWKQGQHEGWYPSGKLAYRYHFKDDEFNGSLREWTEQGVLFRDMNYVMGYEDGSQKVYYSNGKIKSNYVIKNGLRYGLLGTKNCVKVSDDMAVRP